MMRGSRTEIRDARSPDAEEPRDVPSRAVCICIRSIGSEEETLWRVLPRDEFDRGRDHQHYWRETARTNWLCVFIVDEDLNVYISEEEGVVPRELLTCATSGW